MAVEALENFLVAAFGVAWLGTMSVTVAAIRSAAASAVSVGMLTALIELQLSTFFDIIYVRGASRIKSYQHFQQQSEVVRLMKELLAEAMDDRAWESYPHTLFMITKGWILGCGGEEDDSVEYSGYTKRPRREVEAGTDGGAVCAAHILFGLKLSPHPCDKTPCRFKHVSVETAKRMGLEGGVWDGVVSRFPTFRKLIPLVPRVTAK